jgi:uncharacterized protein involved in exopolysaccharide biosynthesis/Mrp family chromosome partitioning ATPase
MTALIHRSEDVSLPREMSGQLGPQHVPPTRALAVLNSRKWLVILVAVLVTAPAVAYISTLRQYFDAQAIVMVNMRKTEFSDLQATVMNVTGDTLSMRTQTDILGSPSLAGRVVDKLDLTHSPFVLEDIAAPPSPRERMTQAVMVLLGMPTPPAAPVSAATRRQMAISWLIDHMSITNDGRSYTITMRARTPDAQLSADIANAYASLYLDFNRELKIQAIARTNALLDHEIVPLQARLQRAEEAVEQFREANGLVSSHGGGDALGDNQQGSLTIADQQLRQINGQLVAARGELVDKQSRLTQVQDALRARGSLDSIPEVVASPLIQQLRQKEADLTGRRAGLGQTAMPQTPGMQALAGEIGELQRRIAIEVNKIAGALQSDVNSAKARVAALQDSMERARTEIVGQSKANVKLQQLVSEASAARVVYRDYLTRYEQTSTQSALQEPEADLISAAEPPVGRAGPARARLMALAGAAGLAIGAFLVLVLARMQGGIRTAEQLEAETGLFPLGFVPVAARMRRGRLERGTTAYTEAVNHVYSTLRFGDARYRAKVVLVTSASPKEGKTFFSISLAASVGRGEGRALLIDGDLRHPSVLREIGTSRAEAELFHTFESSCVSLRRSVLPGVDLMTFARPDGRALHPLDPETLRALVTEARSHYDMIVVDTPPVLAVADAPALASAADGAIMVVAWRRTPTVAINSALYTLQAYGIRVLGGVVTQVKPKELGAAESGHGYLYSTAPRYFSSIEDRPLARRPQA